MSFEETLRAIVRDEVRAALRDERSGDSFGENLTITEAAKFASVGTTTLKKWLHEGRVKSFRDGRIRRVNKAELAAFMKSLTEVSQRDDVDARAAAILRTAGRR